ncbi:hypothetical protein EFP84_14100 [Leptospira kmetyi]|uniref:Uncharacterized protein n=2 Tax=Leptospira kmetyi TaxID=408139 RepID=A0AAD0UQ53_9LEPT|nr:hypothetical protein EFP84_14100 [Leptospira kmetyi]
MKIRQLILLTSLFLIVSCDDGKDKKEDTNMLILGLAQASSICPSDIKMVISTSFASGQVGTPINSFGLKFSSASTSESAILNNPNCKFSNYTVSSNLPAGLSLNPSTGQITGTPTVQGGPYSISFTATLTTGNGTSSTLTGTTSLTIYAAGSLTCSFVGAAGGCGGVNGYSCTNSALCYSSLSTCKAASACGY